MRISNDQILKGEFDKLMKEIEGIWMKNLIDQFELLGDTKGYKTWMHVEWYTGIYSVACLQIVIYRVNNTDVLSKLYLYYTSFIK